ncbi:MAG TPA: hypothetical protein VMF66_18900 [Candidatus Acidoferrum sp.]|nr:hypothetical protein [Candidatus Acidoferrum sp.]
MSRCGKNVLVAFAALLFALPLAARSNNKAAKSNFRTNVELAQDATFAGKDLKAGNYQVRANGSTLTVLQKGKVVAEAPIEWKNEAGKGSNDSSVTINGGAVTEIHFIGKDRYAEIASGSESGATGHE